MSDKCIHGIETDNPTPCQLCSLRAERDDLQAKLDKIYELIRAHMESPSGGYWMAIEAWAEEIDQ